MRRLALVLFAVAALSVWGVTRAPLASGASKVDGDAARIEAVTASAVPLVTGAAHVARSGALSGVTPPAPIVWALAMSVLLGVLALTQPVARSHARSGPSRAPPRLSR
jgi:hypothetical protein